MKTNHTVNISDVTNDKLPGVVEGHWKPSNCVARQRLAIIIPYRDRVPHMRMFLSYFHPMLQRQQLDYTIYVAEQAKPEIFNKAMLMNSGFKAVRQLDPTIDCVIFHDVDMIPLDDRNFFTCSPTPRHVAAYVDKWGFRPFYNRMFGGSVAFPPHYFELVNGYSNTFYGWGGEDDDMYQRTRAKNVVLYERFPQCVGKYRMFQHPRDKGNPSLGMGYLGWRYRPEDYRVNGLNSLKFELVKVDRRPLYVRLVINLPEPPSDILAKIHAKMNASLTTSTTSRPRPSSSTATRRPSHH
jgi:beta-1,4-galactosyltransferase 1